ncbi:hypothetical protein EGR_07310 [Echinococcus granulosus]|uniref:BZIP domain-containing protein n=1 Tax=Echinococcus granulosus TaxID=6210 RepID=W6UWH7_ECHGR|nr:hypothetical protein EGR_07310 [Echinococcus granulosus]EUB57839.1 hypothetical protein EGR_07310 [Echinococcus granulosus]
MDPARRGRKKTVAALTARQYRETKKLELERLKLQLEMFKDAYYRYKKLYEKSQIDLKELSARQVLVNYNNPDSRCFMLEQRQPYISAPTSPDPALDFNPACVSPSVSSDFNFALGFDLTNENWEDPESHQGPPVTTCMPPLEGIDWNGGYGLVLPLTSFQGGMVGT